MHASLLTREAIDDDTDVVGDEVEGFRSYKSEEVIQAGIKSGVYVRGVMHVSRARSQTRAFVKASDQDKSVLFRGDILVVGSAHRNRAMHGDTVAVEILPPSAVLPQDNPRSRAVGKVVGVLRRAWRDTVVTVQEDEGTPRGSKVSGIAGSVVVRLLFEQQIYPTTRG
eukprot:m.92431 g.92431  ORF g.92431 m.92431 type:complete len:168 (+) comp15067_c0_seq6:827-1330(+)